MTVNKTDKKISIIMPVFNGGKYLKQSIDSILNQTYENFEFIIVNDASTDDTHNLIKSYGDDRIILIENDCNIGLTRSLNKALASSTGYFVARQDADDISSRDRLEKQVALFDVEQEVAVVGSNANLIDDRGNITGAMLTIKWPKYTDFLRNNRIVHGSVMIRKNVLNEMGGYNELFKYSQDYYLWLKISKVYKIFNIQEPLYGLRYHQDSISISRRDESALYFILAQKMVDDDIDNSLLNDIKSHGVKVLSDHLSKKDRINYHRLVAQSYVKTNDLANARKEYKKIVHMDMLNYRNYIAYFLTYVNNNIHDRLSCIYHQFRIHV